MKVYNKHYKQKLCDGNEQEEDVESSDEEDWLVHTDEAIDNMDDLGEEFGMVKNGQFDEVWWNIGLEAKWDHPMWGNQSVRVVCRHHYKS